MFSTFSIAGGNVDFDKGVIKNVSVITEGEAKGHGIYIDSKTIYQALEAVKKYKSGLKVKFNHGSGVESIIGFINNFSVQGESLRGDLHLLSSHKERDFILELAQEIPDTFGISISFSQKDPEELNGLFYARIDEIYSADIVGEPAANKQLYEAKVKQDEVDKIKKETMTQIEELQKQLEAANAKVTAFEVIEAKTKLEAEEAAKAAELAAKKKKPTSSAPAGDAEDQADGGDDEDTEGAMKMNKEAIDLAIKDGIQKGLVEQIASAGFKNQVQASVLEAMKPAPKTGKSFNEKVAEKKAELGSLTKAIEFCVKEYPLEYLAARDGGQLNTL